MTRTFARLSRLIEAVTMSRQVRRTREEHRRALTIQLNREFNLRAGENVLPVDEHQERAGG